MSNVIAMQKPWNGRGLLKKHLKRDFLNAEVEVQKQEAARLSRLLWELDAKICKARQDLIETKRRLLAAEKEVI